MRVVHTFVVRLLTDSEEPGALRGVVRAVADAQVHPFGDEPALLDILRVLVRESALGGQGSSGTEAEASENS